MVERENITGIILAGGKSTRMGSDKGLLPFNGKPFIQYSIDALRPLVSEILIVSDDDVYDQFGLKRVNDKLKDAGPVSGICSGLEASTTEYNFVLSCDIPLIKTDVLVMLLSASNDTYNIIQAESLGKTMPLVALYKKKVRNHFQRALDKGERRLRFVIGQCCYKNVVLPNGLEITTKNVNTKQEFKELQHAYNR